MGRGGQNQKYSNLPILTTCVFKLKTRTTIVVRFCCNSLFYVAALLGRSTQYARRSTKIKDLWTLKPLDFFLSLSKGVKSRLISVNLCSITPQTCSNSFKNPHFLWVPIFAFKPCTLMHLRTFFSKVLFTRCPIGAKRRSAVALAKADSSSLCENNF